ncbi:MAG: TIGR01620 family protein, partial [Rhodobacteraceae bacterium]
MTPRKAPVVIDLDADAEPAPPVRDAPPVPDATPMPDGAAMQAAARLAARPPSRLARLFWALAGAVLGAV